MKTALRALLVGASLLATLPHRAAAADVPAADATGIKATILDYIEGWYAGDAARMERALHPDLAKRQVRTDAPGKTTVQHMGALYLVQLTRAGGGNKTPPDKQLKDVTILDVSGNLACAKLVAAAFTDYLQLAKLGDRWVIVNVLWAPKPKTD
jgi:hypothetical protein